MTIYTFQANSAELRAAILSHTRGRVLEQTDQALTVEAEPSLIRLALLVLAGLLG